MPHLSPSCLKEKLTPNSEWRSWLLWWSLSEDLERMEPCGRWWCRNESVRRSRDCDLERLMRAWMEWTDAAVTLSLLLLRPWWVGAMEAVGGSSRSTYACCDAARSERASAPIITRGSPFSPRLTTDGRRGAGPFTRGIS